jgi:PGF-pre-PGF domain-containing protein
MRKLIPFLTLLLFAAPVTADLNAVIDPSDPGTVTLDGSNSYQTTFTFDGSGSEGNNLSYSWTNKDNQDTTSGATGTFTFNRDSPASNTIELEIDNKTHTDIEETDSPLNVQDTPNVTISTPDSTSISTGETVDFSSSVTNAFDDPITYAWKVDGANESASDSFSRTFDNSGDFDVKVTVTDQADNSNTSNTITVSVSSSSSPSNNNPRGSSGGNIHTGGQAGQPNHTATFSNVSSGASVTVNVEKSEQIGVNSVFIQVNTPAKEITVTVTKQDGKPADVEQDFEGKTYRYMDIEAEGINDSGIETSVVRFSVNTSWIQENNIDPNRVFLNRYVNGQWNRLSTGKMVETSSKVVYEAETPGFSYFAVSSDEQQEQQETEQNDSEQTSSTCGDGLCASGETAASCPQDCETQQEESTEENTTDTDSSTNTGNKLGVSKSTAILAVLIIIAVGLAYYWHRQGKENAEEPQ